MTRPIRNLFVHFAVTYPRQSLTAVGALLLAGMLEGVSIAMFLPIVEIAMAGQPSHQSPLGEAMRRALNVFGLPPALPILLGIMVSGMVLKAVLQWLAMRKVGYAVALVATDLRIKLMTSLLNAEWEFFSKHPIGRFANAIGFESKIASNTYRSAALLVAGSIVLSVYVVMALIISWQTALMALATGALVFRVLRRFLAMGQEAGRNQISSMKTVTARLTDALQGVKAVKAMAREDRFLPFLEAETQSLNRALRLKVLAVESLSAFQEPVTMAVMAAGLYFALTFGKDPFASLLVLGFLFVRMVNQINSMVRNYQSLVVEESAFASLSASIGDAVTARESTAGTVPPPSLKESIEIENVSFAYGDHPVLQDLSLRIPAGRLVALLGPSGSGKTTVVDLVAGLIRPKVGRICVDGVPLETIDIRAWRRRIGYVPQEMFLFHDTVEHNVTLGDPDLTRADAEDALRAAGAWAFVSAFPNGMNTVIGERGSSISGGQRQRIAIARALARKPSLLILDEATTALDPSTEAALCDTLKGLRGSMTILAISHQAAIGRVADIAYRLENGRTQVLSPRPAD